jgi:hypothetical protein
VNPWKSIALQARRQLLWFGIAFTLVILLVIASHYFRNSLQRGVDQDEGLLVAQTANLAAKQTDLDNIQTHIQEFRSLKERGLVGNGDREGWVEQLVATRTTLRLPDSLTYTLNPDRSISDNTKEAAVDPPAATNTARAHDLDFEFKEIHENELLKLLQQYQSKVHGRFRIQSCALTSPGPQGLFIKCTLRFFTLPETAPAA